MSETKDDQLDAYAMDRYSRQMGAIGVETQARLIKLRVLIVGLRGVGIEIAKNLVLQGPGAVTIVDDETVNMRDLGTNFFLREADVGKKTRAQACVPHLQALNRLVEIKVHGGKLTKDLVRDHSAVVLCGASREEALGWNEFCRAHNIGFLMCGVLGVFGYAFVDLGKEFLIRDKNGEQPVNRIIDGIEVVEGSNEILVHLIPPPDGQRHNIESTDHEGFVTFDEVEGKLGTYLNGKGPFKVQHVYNERKDSKTGKTKKVFDAYSLRVTIDGAKTLPPFEGGSGLLQQKKVPVKMKFRSLEANLEQPISPGEYSLLFTDGAKFGRAEQLHVALMGVWEFQDKNKGKLPKANSKADIDQVVQLAMDRNDKMLEALKNSMSDSGEAPPCLGLEEVDEDVIRNVARFAACEFQPMSTFFGGIIAQEIVKLTGKFTPLNQWLHIDCFEVLPELFVDEDNKDRFIPSDSDRKPLGSRYDDLIEILGRPMQEAMTKKSTFMIGCGALGCELLKNFALLGVACSEDGAGLITVTDNDTIEVSNLSRQFLFREHNVGQPKSSAAGVAAKEMNPAFNIKPLQQFVGPSTEGIFNDPFWEGLDFVTNALDNVKARVYVDGQCVFYGKPLLESGTLGTKCNVQVVLPNLTQSYADGPKDNEGDSIPMCTLRNFPSTKEHCIEWARARFTDLFSTAAMEASNYCRDPEKWLQELHDKTLGLDAKGKVVSAVETELPPLREMVQVLNQSASPDNCFAECVKEAYLCFHRLFRDPIESLVRTYPKDAKDKNGDPFWVGTKRFPTAAKFDVTDDSHIDFVISCANLLAVNYGLQPADQPLGEDHPWRSPAHVRKIVEKFPPPKLVLEKVDMSGGGEDDAENAKNDHMEVDEDSSIKEFTLLMDTLKEMQSKAGDIVVEAAEFEKDADWNFHIDFITAASNLRGWNYRIKPVSRHECKMIAGKIIPALATTTASVTGLVMIEMIKMLQPGKKLEAFKDSSNSLGINGYFFSEPSPPSKEKDEYDPIEMSEVKCKPSGFTKWDKTMIKAGALTLGQFLEEFKSVTGLNCTSLNHSSANRVGSQGHSQFIYEKNAWKKELKQKYEERLDQQLEEVIFNIYGEDALPAGRKYVLLEVSTEDDDENPWKVPSVVYYFA